MKYRSEIDGLRALAIVPVVLFHAGIAGFAGVYVGVDVFFVISGYLITTLILQDLERGRFSILDFYERRARRLLPALFTVLAVCCGFAVAWMPPAALSDFSQNLIATSLFVSNIALWYKTNYFSSRAEENPLLHMWSLAVEEQFYILFPLLMLLLWRSRNARVMLAVLMACFLASLTISEYGWRNHAGANFFLLPSRAFELLAGSICALVLARRQVGGQGALALLGLAMIAVSVIWFDSATPFPSLWTLLPVGGTALVILFARADTLAGRVLGWQPVVLVGLISYSTYLWHQPLFAFARLRNVEEPGLALMLTLSALSLGLGWLTWRFVERPFRKGGGGAATAGALPPPLLVTQGRVFGAAGAGLALFIGLGAAGLASDGLIQRHDSADRALVRMTPENQDVYVRHNFNSRLLAPFPDNGLPNILIIGDSFAQDLMNAIVETGLEARANLSSHYINPRCGNLYVEGDLSDYLNPEHRAVCREESGYRSAELHQRMAEADTIFIVASWRGWNVDFIEESFGNIARHTAAQLVLVGRKSFGIVSIPRFLRVPADERAGLRLTATDTHLQTNERMRRHDLPFIDLHEVICGEGPDCPVFTADEGLISYDGSHLTREGAIHVGQALLRDSALWRRIFGLEAP